MTDSPHELPGRSADLQSALRADALVFPFKTELSLAPLIAFWTRAAADWNSARGRIARSVLDEIQKAPELAEPVLDVTAIERHRDLLDVLMSAAFPTSAWNEEYGAAMTPFQLHGFYATPSFRRLLMAEDGKLSGHINLDDRMIAIMRRAYAYAVVLRRLYGIALDVSYPLIFTVSDPDTGLDRHFRLLIDETFVDVVALGPVPDLSDALIRRLRANILDPELLRDALPPENVVFRGITIFRALEVTGQEVVSALKRDLIERDSIVSDVRFVRLQQRLRTLFRRPDLILVLAAIEGDRVLVLNHGAQHGHACIFADSAHHTAAEFAGSIYERAVTSGQPVIVEDLAALSPRTAVEERLVQSGTRSLLAAPLRYQDRTIGSLMLSSPQPGQLDTMHLPQLQEVVPLFSMAVQRSMEELNARIQTEIKERFTAIHPTVEWRFRKAVLDSMERGEGAGCGEGA
ncbi:MAG: GAF domain-containing protein [Candidatus Rokubacteria bacterium]|nr:GAF domain-containing protein [Candidatus Rokubacteria bacterium]